MLNQWIHTVKGFLQGVPSAPDEVDAKTYQKASLQVDAFWKDAEQAGLNSNPGYLQYLPNFTALSSQPDSFKSACAYIALTRIPVSNNENGYLQYNYRVITLLILKAIDSATPAMLSVFAQLLARLKYWEEISNIAPHFLRLVTAARQESPLGEDLKLSLALLRFPGIQPRYGAQLKEARQFDAAIQRLVDENGIESPYFTGHPLNQWLVHQDLNSDQKSFWAKLLPLCDAEGEKSKPSEKWLKQLKAFHLEHSGQLSETFVIRLLEEAIELIKKQHELDGRELWKRIAETLPQWFCGFAWYVGVHWTDSPGVRIALDKTAVWCLKKKAGFGALAAKQGNACLRAFSLMPGTEGVSVLLRFRARATNRNISKLADTLLDETARRHGMNRADIEDLSVGHFDLDARQQRVESIGDYCAVIAIKSHKEVTLEWQTKEGKSLKSVPTAVKAEKAGLKQIQAVYKELKDAFSLQFARTENAYIDQRTWSYPIFQSRFEQHPVMQSLTARLIWVFEKGNRQVAAIRHEGRWQNPWGEATDWFDVDTMVRLWHPLGVEPQKVLEWRDWLQQQQLTQPFKQAYREIYLVTPPELTTNTYSNRFAAHILRQHQFAALCHLRDWQYRLQGAFDSHNTPRREVPKWGYAIEFWVDSGWDNNHVSDSGIYLYVQTDQVRFYKGQALVPVAEVPPLLFSELMRDVDLFVGVGSIGNDPNWQDNGDVRFGHYWQAYAFSEQLSASGEVRKAALERLIPKLKIADKCRFEGKYLIVKGTRHSYKIHCGSGNILMSPNDRYLCIVPDSSPKTASPAVYLPFEGDRLLSIIISKAVLLANDDKIKDESILLQL